MKLFEWMKKKKEEVMKIRMFAVYDSAAKTFGFPMGYLTPGQAQRGFTDAVNDEKSQMFMHPEDFSLFEVGVYDDQSGCIEVPKMPSRVVTALDVKRKEESRA